MVCSQRIQGLPDKTKSTVGDEPAAPDKKLQTRLTLGPGRKPYGKYQFKNLTPVAWAKEHSLVKHSILYPAVLEHAAALIGKTPWEVSRSATLLAQAHIRAHEIYAHSPVVCGIDVYHAEVEAWGGEVRPQSHAQTPALTRPLFENVSDILNLPALDPEHNGRFPMFCAAASAISGKFSCEVQVPVGGPVSLAIGLLGFENLLLEFAESTAAIGAVIAFLARHQAGLCAKLIALGFRPAIYESGAAPPLVSPEIFQRIVAPALSEVLQAGRAAGRPLTCIIGGNVALIAEAMLRCGPGYVICPAETDQVAFMRAALKFPEIAVRVNMPASVLASGDRMAINRTIDRLLPLALDHPRGLLGTGVVPFDCQPAWVLDAQRYAGQRITEIGGR